MTCPKCGSENTTIQIIQEGKYGSFLTFLVRLILFFWIFLIWLLSLLIRTSRIKNKTIAICNNCGNTWKPKPRNELSRKRKIERAATARANRIATMQKIKESQFWKNDYFGYLMIFILAPLGVILMNKYNQNLRQDTKKMVTFIALFLWTILFFFIALTGNQGK